jgi:hypothetical protein
MDLRTFPAALVVLALLLSCGARAGAQSAGRFEQTWGNADSRLIMRVMGDAQARRRLPAAVDSSAVTFKPAGDSGVARALADALGVSEQSKAELKELFAQIKQGYETDVVKEGKSNNLAAAFTFFIALNVMAYRREPEPSDGATETLFGELQRVITSAPELSRLPDAEKQRMHDWLVCVAGYTLVHHAVAKQTGDARAADINREFAAYALRLVLGVEASRLSFKGEQFVVEADNPPARPATAPDERLVGVWSKSASSPWGTAPGAVATNAGYYKGQYQFKADGTYGFKGESWGGYSRSDEFWTIVESGVYAVEGDTLTVSPKTSTATLRGREGAVRKTQNNQPEKVTYRWKLHFFEGIGETNLVLVPPRQTTRDGGFAANSDFPNSYLYSRNGNLEWRF